jgi:hypothetical protein
MRNNLKQQKGRFQESNPPSQATAADIAEQISSSLKGVDYVIFPKEKDGVRSLFKRLSNRGKPTVFLVTAPSGAGKSWFASRLRDVGMLVHDLDKFGSIVEGKWLLDVPQITETVGVPTATVILVGVSDNLGEVMDALHRKSRSGKDFNLNLLFLVPALNSFRTANQRKYDEGFKKELPNAWLLGWLSKSKISRSELVKYLRSKFELYLSWFVTSAPSFSNLLNKDALLLAIEFDRNTDSGVGWHRDPSNDEKSSV